MHDTCTVEPLNCRHIGMDHFVNYRESVLFLRQRQHKFRNLAEEEFFPGKIALLKPMTLCSVEKCFTTLSGMYCCIYMYMYTCT